MKKSEPLGLRVSWVKTKIQTFNDILDVALLSVCVQMASRFVTIPSPTYFQLLLEFVRSVYWPSHFSVLVWTGFWRDQAALHRLGMSRSWTLILQMMQSSLRRL